LGIGFSSHWINGRLSAVRRSLRKESAKAITRQVKKCEAGKITVAADIVIAGESDLGSGEPFWIASSLRSSQ
jgi:hypothetical protein